MTRFVFFALSILLFSISTVKANESPPLLIGMPDVLPYSSPQLPHYGFYPELIEAAFTRVDISVSFVFLPFKRILKMLEAGLLVGAGSVSHKPEREAFLLYPKEPLYTDKIRVFQASTNPNRPKFRGLASLKGSTIGTFGGGFIEKELAKHKVDYESASSATQHIRMLLSGRVNFIISPELPLNYALKKDINNVAAGDILALRPAYKEDKQYLAFAKNHPDSLRVIDAFNLGLSLIKKDGTYNKIKAKYLFSNLSTE